MEEEMIEVTTNIRFPEERLEEIFSVPKTKALFDQLVQKEENVKRIGELIKLSANVVQTDANDEKELEQLSSNVTKDIRIFILAKAIEEVIKGKSLNQAMCAILKREFKTATVFDLVEKRLVGQMSISALFRIFM